MKPTSKTPYEIRLELLQLAQVILHNKHAAAAIADSGQLGSTKATTAPTSEDIIAEADKLNGFVSKSNSPLTH